MFSEYSFIFLLGHTCRFILGILFLDIRLHIASILADTSIVLSKLVVLMHGILINILINTGYYQAFAFSQCNGTKMAAPGCFLWAHMGRATQCNFTVSHLCASCFIMPGMFSHFSTSPHLFFFDDPNSKIPLKPLVVPSSSKCILLFCFIYYDPSWGNVYVSCPCIIINSAPFILKSDPVWTMNQ